MDPYGPEAELAPLHTAFHQGQHALASTLELPSLAPSNTIPARVLQLRARLALGQAEAVLAEVEGETAPELQAVGALARVLSGDVEGGVEVVEGLVEELKEGGDDNGVVRVLGGVVFVVAGRVEEALALVGGHQGSCEYFCFGFS